MHSTEARRLLDAELARLSELHSASEALVDQAEESEASELSHVDQHQGDIGSELGEREKQRATADLVESDLAEVKAAIERLEAGSYGTCERCGKAIADGRLEAKPAARYCIDCQTLVESGRA